MLLIGVRKNKMLSCKLQSVGDVLNVIFFNNQIEKLSLQISFSLIIDEYLIIYVENVSNFINQNFLTVLFHIYYFIIISFPFVLLLSKSMNLFKRFDSLTNFLKMDLYQ